MALTQPASQAGSWHDWDRTGWELSPSDQEAMARLTGRTLGDFLRELRDTAESPADWLFHYDNGHGRLELGQVLCTDRPQSMLIIFAHGRHSARTRTIRRKSGMASSRPAAGIGIEILTKSCLPLEPQLYLTKAEIFCPR